MTNRFWWMLGGGAVFSLGLVGLIVAAVTVRSRDESMEQPARLLSSAQVQRVAGSMAGLSVDAKDIWQCVVMAPPGRASLIHAWRVVAFMDEWGGDGPSSPVAALWRRGLTERFGVSLSASVPQESGMVIDWPSLEEAHSGQFLAAMAECGVPAQAIVRTSGGQWTIQQLLEARCSRRDVLAEPEFATVPFAMYHRKQASRFWGLRDYCGDVLESLSNSAVKSAAPCSGTHRLYSMAVLLNVNQAVPILSGEAENRGRLYLERIGAQLQALQHVDGAWRFDWADDSRFTAPKGASADWGEDIAITAHHLEWIAVNPFHTVSDTSVLRALEFIDRSIRTASTADIRKNYCGYTHAIRALLLWHAQVRDENSGSE